MPRGESLRQARFPRAGIPEDDDSFHVRQTIPSVVKGGKSNARAAQGVGQWYEDRSSMTRRLLGQLSPQVRAVLEPGEDDRPPLRHKIRQNGRPGQLCFIEGSVESAAKT
jgi:hypothetical protein